MCEQKETVLEDRAVEQDDGFGFGIRGLAQIVDVAVGPQAAEDGGTGRGSDGVALRVDGDFAVVADAHAGLQAPDIRPPGTGGSGTEHGTVFGQGLLAGGGRGGAQFAMDFVLVDVRQQFVEQAVGAFEFPKVLSRQERRQALLPVVVAAFDFAFGLRRGCIAQGHAVEVQGLAQMGEGVGGVGEEEGVVVYVEGQRQAVGLEDARQEVQVGQEGFGGVEPRAGVVAGGIVQEVEPDLFFGAVG